MTNGGFCLWPIRKKKKKERKRQRKKRRKTIKENGELTSFFLSRHRRKIKGRERRKRKKRILSLASSQTEEKGEEKGEKEKGGKRYKRMAYLPHSFPVGINGGFRGGALSSSSSFGAEEPADKDSNMQSIEQHVLNLIYPDLRENALLELSKKRELFLDLAPLLWNSFGTMTALLQEIVSIYPFLSPPNLTRAQSNRVCNALTLLQCVASHPDTRMLLLDAKIPLYLVPFLKTTSKSTPFEYLRLTSLGVFGSLVKVGDTEVISSVISTEIFPRCLHTMEIGCEPSKTVATFIVQQILLDDEGLDYICSSAERFFEVARFLGNMVGALAEQPSSGLLKLIIRCYLRLSDNQRACDALRNYLPNTLRDTTFSSCFHADPVMRRWLLQLIHNTSGNRVAR